MKKILLFLLVLMSTLFSVSAVLNEAKRVNKHYFILNNNLGSVLYVGANK